MSRLAVLVPAHNAAGHIGRLFDSIDAQTVPFDEVLVYDDASTDGTGGIAAARGARVVRSELNTGPSVGKNRLVELTSAEWVHFHDADDALQPDFSARAREWVARDSADVVLFATQDRDDRTNQPLGTRLWDSAALTADPVRYAIVETITNCGLYRRNAFLAAGGFDARPSVRFNEDQAMHLRLALRGMRFAADASPGVILYQRIGSMSSANRIECVRASVEVMADVAQRTGSRYSREIGARLWRLAGLAGGYSDWVCVDRALRVAAALPYRFPHEEHWAMGLMALVSGRGAIRLREFLIRTFKAHLRQGMPRVDEGRRQDSGPASVEAS